MYARSLSGAGIGVSEGRQPFQVHEAKRLQQLVAQMTDDQLKIDRRVALAQELHEAVSFGRLPDESKQSKVAESFVRLLLAEWPEGGDVASSPSVLDRVVPFKIAGSKVTTKFKSLRRAAADALSDMSNYQVHFYSMAGEGLFTDEGLGKLMRDALPLCRWEARIKDSWYSRDQVYPLAARMVAMCANIVRVPSFAAWLRGSAVPAVLANLVTPREILNRLASKRWAEAERRRLQREAARRKKQKGKGPADDGGGRDTRQQRDQGAVDGADQGDEASFEPTESDLFGDTTDDEEDERRLRRAAEAGDKQLARALERARKEAARRREEAAKEAAREREAYHRDVAGLEQADADEAAYWDPECCYQGSRRHKDLPETLDPDHSVPMCTLRDLIYMDATRLIVNVVVSSSPSSQQQIEWIDGLGALAKLEGMTGHADDILEAGRAVLRSKYTEHALRIAPRMRSQALGDRSAAEAARAEGSAAAAAGDLRKAVRCYCGALALDGSDAGVLGALSAAWMRLGHPTRATQAAADAVALEPDSPEAWACWGGCFLSQKRHQLAQLCFGAALEMGGRKEAVQPRLDEALTGLAGAEPWTLDAPLAGATAAAAAAAAALPCAPGCVRVALEERPQIDAAGIDDPGWGAASGRSERIASTIKVLAELGRAARQGAAALRAAPTLKGESWMLSWTDTPFKHRETGLTRCLVTFHAMEEGGRMVGMAGSLGVPRTKQVMLAFRRAVLAPAAAGGDAPAPKPGRPSCVLIADRLLPWADEIAKELRAAGVEDVWLESGAEARLLCIKNNLAHDGFNFRGRYVKESVKKLRDE